MRLLNLVTFASSRKNWCWWSRNLSWIRVPIRIKASYGVEHQILIWNRLTNNSQVVNNHLDLKHIILNVKISFLVCLKLKPQIHDVSLWRTRKLFPKCYPHLSSSSNARQMRKNTWTEWTINPRFNDSIHAIPYFISRIKRGWSITIRLRQWNQRIDIALKFKSCDDREQLLESN